MTDSPQSPVIICQKCGAQHDLPTTICETGKDPWLRCRCGGTTFSLRMRVPMVKTEPAA
jgi:hypothetical protein